MTSEQHLPYRATGDVVVLDGDGSRWVREVDLTCPWLTDGHECAVYPVRPEVCRVYRCDRHVRGELRGFFGSSAAEVVDMRELAERWCDDAL